LLERGRILLGNVLDVVMLANVCSGGVTHPYSEAWLAQFLERVVDRRYLVVSDWNLERDVVGQLGEPADIADDERLAERERANRAPGRLPHRRGAEEDAGVASAHERPEALLLDVRLADHARGDVVQREAGRLGADDEQPRLRARVAERREGAQQLWDALAVVDMPEAAEDGRATDDGRLDIGCRPRRMGNVPERAVVAVLANARLDVARVHDHSRGAIEHLSRERELRWTDLPEWRHAAFEHAPTEHPARNAGLPLHRGEIRVRVAAADRRTCDEMMDDEVVQHDDAGAPQQRIEDPAVRVWVVADVVQRDVRVCHRAGSPRPHDLDVEQPLERRQQQGGVVGDPAPARRQRTEIRNLHRTPASRRSMQESHVTAQAMSRPARPSTRASSAWSRSQTHARASSSTVGATTRPVSRSRTISSGPPASVVVTTGFSERNASNGTRP
jgi:hypothetical protein